jgi:hypothetical protein
VVSRRSRRWIRRNWGNLGKNTRACLKGAALMTVGDILRDQRVSRVEWRALLNIHYPWLFSPVERLYVDLEFKLRNYGDAVAVGCFLGWAAIKIPD